MSAFEKFAENQMAAAFSLPDLVKKADEATLTPPHKAGAFYADPVALKYACHNAPATLYSTAMLLFEGREKNANFTTVLDRLEKSATHFGVHGEFADLVDQDTKMRDIAQEKLADDQFALVTNYEGHTLRQYPIRNKEEVKAAAEFLKRNRSNFRFVDRNKIARKILARAHEFECDSVLNDEVIIKTAGAAIADGVTAGTFLRKVSTLVKNNPTDLKNLTIVTKSAEAMPMLPNDFALKVAGAVDDIYRDNKVNASVLPAASLQGYLQLLCTDW